MRLWSSRGRNRPFSGCAGPSPFSPWSRTWSPTESFYSLATIRTGVARDLREQLFDRVLALPVGYFTEQRKGDLISRMTNDLMEVEFSVIGTLEVLFKAPIMILLSLVTLFAISWELTLFALVFMPVSGFIISRIATALRGAAGRGKERLGDLISRLEETLGAMVVVKAYDAAPRFRTRFSSTTRAPG